MEPLPHRILLVDADPDSCDALFHLLWTAGYGPDIAPTPAAAMELVRSRHYDLMLLVHRPPDLDALALYRQLKWAGQEATTLLVGQGMSNGSIAAAVQSGVERIVPGRPAADLLLSLLSELLSGSIASAPA